jgi:hypothetical protein
MGLSPNQTQKYEHSKSVKREDIVMRLLPLPYACSTWTKEVDPEVWDIPFAVTSKNNPRKRTMLGFRASQNKGLP